jgi:hypothetical protein
MTLTNEQLAHLINRLDNARSTVFVVAQGLLHRASDGDLLAATWLTEAGETLTTLRDGLETWSQSH